MLSTAAATATASSCRSGSSKPALISLVIISCRESSGTSPAALLAVIDCPSEAPLPGHLSRPLYRRAAPQGKGLRRRPIVVGSTNGGEDICRQLIGSRFNKKANDWLARTNVRNTNVAFKPLRERGFDAVRGMTPLMLSRSR